VLVGWVGLGWSTLPSNLFNSFILPPPLTHPTTHPPSPSTCMGYWGVTQQWVRAQSWA